MQHAVLKSLQDYNGDATTVGLLSQYERGRSESALRAHQSDMQASVKRHTRELGNKYQAILEAAKSMERCLQQ